MTFLQYVCSTLLGKPQRNGQAGESWWHCPFHEEDRTPSFHTRPQVKQYKDRWSCFGCGAWGDDYDFIWRSLPNLNQEGWSAIWKQLHETYLHEGIAAKQLEATPSLRLCPVTPKVTNPYAATPTPTMNTPDASPDRVNGSADVPSGVGSGSGAYRLPSFGGTGSRREYQEPSYPTYCGRPDMVDYAAEVASRLSAEEATVVLRALEIAEDYNVCMEHLAYEIYHLRAEKKRTERRERIAACLAQGRQNVLKRNRVKRVNHA